MFEVTPLTGEDRAALRDSLAKELGRYQDQQKALEKMKCRFGFDLVDFSQRRKNELVKWPCWEVLNFVTQSREYIGY